MILQRAGDDLGGGGGPRVDQHHQRDTAENVGPLGAEGNLRVFHPSLRIDDGPLVQERVGHRHRGAQYATGIVSQVEHEALEAAVAGILPELVYRLAQVLAGPELELADPDVSVSRLDRAAAHAGDLDDVPGDGDPDGPIHAFAHDGEHDVGAGLPAHHLHRIGQRHSLHRGVVEPDHQIPRLDAGALRGGIVDGRDHLDEPVLHADLDSQAPELAARARLQLLVVVGDEVGGVRVESGQHPADGVLEQRPVPDRLDVIVLDLGEDLREGAEILKRQRCTVAALRENALSESEEDADCAPGEETGDRSCEWFHIAPRCAAEDSGSECDGRILAAAKGLQAPRRWARRTIAAGRPGCRRAGSRSRGRGADCRRCRRRWR